MSADAAARQRSRLALESMEERTVPAVFTVANLADTGTGTLREALLNAEKTPEADTIKFATGLSGTIKLSAVGSPDHGGSAFLIQTPITIDGFNGAGGITIARDSTAANMRLFEIGSNGDLTLKGVTLSGGVAEGSFSTTDTTGKGLGGAIYNQGKLTVLGVTISGNDAVGADAVAPTPIAPAASGTTTSGATGTTSGTTTGTTGTTTGTGTSTTGTATGSATPGDGDGGGIYNDGGTLTIQESTFAGNRGLAGNPVTGGATGKGLGGGVFNRNGTVTIQNSTLSTNVGADGGRQVYSLGDAGTASLKIDSSILGQADMTVTDVVAAFANAGHSDATGGTNLIRTSSGYTGTSTLTADPKLGLLANNGGPTKSFAPQKGSPAIDAGGQPNGSPSDQRGGSYLRTSNRKTDLGSVETQVAQKKVYFATGTGIGSEPRVVEYDQNGNVIMSFYAYDRAFTGGVNVAVGDVNGDGVPDIVTVPKQGPSHVKVFDGVTGAEIYSFYAYDPSLVAGFNVAVGDLNGDGNGDIVTVPSNFVTHVKAFSGATGEEIRSFYAYDPKFTGGASLAVADMDGDGFADITTGAQGSGAPHVKTFSGATGQELASFYAFDSQLIGGVTVAVGDINGDGKPDYLVTAGQGGGGIVVALDGTTHAKIKVFQPVDATFADGMSLQARDLNGDGIADLIVGPPNGLPGQVKLIDGATSTTLLNVQPYTLDYAGGVSIG